MIFWKKIKKENFSFKTGSNSGHRSIFEKSQMYVSLDLISRDFGREKTQLMLKNFENSKHFDRQNISPRLKSADFYNKHALIPRSFLDNTSNSSC
jgi:hypothetical protein